MVTSQAVRSSARITIDLNDVPQWYVEQVTHMCSNVVHVAHDDFGSLAVLTVTPLDIEEVSTPKEANNA